MPHRKREINVYFSLYSEPCCSLTTKQSYLLRVCDVFVRYEGVAGHRDSRAVCLGKYMIIQVFRNRRSMGIDHESDLRFPIVQGTVP